MGPWGRANFASSEKDSETPCAQKEEAYIAALGTFSGTAMSSQDQREKLIRLLLTAQMLAVDLGDRALADQIKKAINQAREGFVRSA